MGFFDKLFGKSKKMNVDKSVAGSHHQQPCKTEDELLEKYGGIALEKQLDLGEFIGEYDWDVDMETETICFGGKLTFSFQILGTFSFASGTWLWAWANTQSGISENLLQQALQLKKYGEEHNIDLLKNAKFDFSENQMHIIGIIATGMYDADGYYIASYGQGAMLITLTDDKIKAVRNDVHYRIFSVFPQLISLYELNHRNALEFYLKAKGYDISATETFLEGQKEGNIIQAEFDELSRLKNLRGK